jgi:hypothetical protein
LAIGRRTFLRLFVRHFDRAEVKHWIAIGAELRLSDRTLPQAERQKVARLKTG